MERLKQMSKQELTKRLCMTVFGVLLSGICVGFYKLAAFGVDPFQVVAAGADQISPLSFGTTYVILNVLLLMFSLFADRHYIGLATFVNLFLLGYVAQFTYDYLLRTFPDITLVGRIISFLIGVVAMCFASSMYFTADMGVSTYDAVALIISGTWKKGKFKFVRIICDLVCVLGGTGLYFLGGGTLEGLFAILSIGTIITAFFMGPLIDYFNVHCSIPFLYGKDSEEAKAARQ